LLFEISISPSKCPLSPFQRCSFPPLPSFCFSLGARRPPSLVLDTHPPLHLRPNFNKARFVADLASLLLRPHQPFLRSEQVTETTSVTPCFKVVLVPSADLPNPLDPTQSFMSVPVQEGRLHSTSRRALLLSVIRLSCQPFLQRRFLLLFSQEGQRTR